MKAHVTRVKEQIRENLIRCQRECYQLLVDAIMHLLRIVDEPAYEPE
jgi:hypothetical protein